MEKVLPKNRPTRCEFVFVKHEQLEQSPPKTSPKKISSAKGEDIAKILTGLLNDIAKVADKTFVMMKNKRVWYDRNNAALFPKFETGVLRAFNTYSRPAVNYEMNLDGFYFVAMTEFEFNKSFRRSTANPYITVDGSFKYFPVRKFSNSILTEEINANGSSHIMTSDGAQRWWKDNDEITLVPIHRTQGKNASASSYPGAFLYWASRGLIPEGLTNQQENLYFKAFAAD